MHHNSPTVSIKLSFGYDATHTHARMFKTNKKMNLEYDHFHSLMITLSNAMGYWQLLHNINRFYPACFP